MRDDFDEELPLEGPEYPTIVTIAGVIWLVFGALILLNGGVNVLLSLAQGQGRGEEARAAGGMCGMLFVAFAGGVFIHVGVQSVRGTAKDTLGNGVGSLLFALLIGGGGVVWLMNGLAAGGDAAVVGVLVGSINLLAALGLLAAGVLALVGRPDYRAWRRATRPRRIQR